MVVPANRSIWNRGAEGTGMQGESWLHIKLEATVDSSKETEQNKKIKQANTSKSQKSKSKVSSNNEFTNS